MTATFTQLLTGDAREWSTWKSIQKGTVQCVVTSPPYYGLRDYGHDLQIGNESDPEYYIKNIVHVFDHVRHTMRDDATLWLNLGDTYIGGDLQQIPHRVAMAMRRAGWVLRSEIIWHKPDAMTETSTNRPGRDHEHLFLLTRRTGAYFYDPFAVREQGKYTESRGLRTVWTIPTSRVKGLHFAPFPERLAGRCILAGTSEGGACAGCGAPAVRQVQRIRTPTRPGNTAKTDATRKSNRDPQRHVTSYTSHGFLPGCECGAATRPCVVLDPFAGSGTTLRVSQNLGCSAIGIELNSEYVSIAEKRIARSE